MPGRDGGSSGPWCALGALGCTLDTRPLIEWAVVRAERAWLHTRHPAGRRSARFRELDEATGRPGRGGLVVELGGVGGTNVEKGSLERAA